VTAPIPELAPVTIATSPSSVCGLALFFLNLTIFIDYLGLFISPAMPIASIQGVEE